MEKVLLLRFIIGSSILSGAISFSYIGAGMQGFRNSAKWSPNVFNAFEWMMGFVLVLMGIFNSAIYLVQKNLDLDPDLSMVIGGALFGLTLSSIGRFGFDFPVKVFKFTKSNQFLVHIFAALLYSFVFGVIINYLNKTLTVDQE